jgi:hypothetical protein
MRAPPRESLAIAYGQGTYPMPHVGACPHDRPDRVEVGADTATSRPGLIATGLSVSCLPVASGAPRIGLAAYTAARLVPTERQAPWRNRQTQRI